MSDRELATLSVNTIRTLSIDAIQKANSGHPGLPLGCAPMAYVLWQRHLRHNPRDPSWFDRDRFVLSPGHGSMLIYSLLHLAGYALSLDDIKAFRQWKSLTPGHPESFITAGVECTTGPLGQGSANAVGMAMAERFLANQYNRPGHTVIDHFTYAIVSDGDLMEGVAAEAGSLAGHLGLGKLIYMYDANDITLDGPTSMTFTADVCKQYESYGWHVIKVENGDTDLDALDAAITAAKAETERPTLIWVHTTIGYGSPNKAGSHTAHGSPLGVDEVAATKKALGCDPDKHFDVPAEVAQHMSAVARGADLQASWEASLEAYVAEHGELAAQLQASVAGELPEGWDADLPSFEAGTSLATRVASGKALNAIAAKVPWLLGGDADLAGSTKSLIAGEGNFDGRTGAGRNLRFGVREHAMAAICNGFQYHGGTRSYTATFFVFSDYMRPSVRLAALNHLPVIHIWTHDSIGLGEDGPTHQPVEHMMSLRAMPNLHVVRPGDAAEAAEAWRYAMNRTEGPTGLVLSRQGMAVIDRSTHGSAAGTARGGYVLAEGDDVALIATGSEVGLALAAREQLAADGISARVVSMPCWGAFDAQSDEYRESVLPAAMRARVSVEAGVTLGWERYVGLEGASVGVDRYGASAPANVLMEKYGLTASNVAATARRVLGR